MNAYFYRRLRNVENSLVWRPEYFQASTLARDIKVRTEFSRRLIFDSMCKVSGK